MILLTGFICSIFLGLLTSRLALVYIHKLSSSKLTKANQIFLFLLSAITFFLLFYFYRFSYQFFVLIFFTFILITVSFIDYKKQIIPDILSLLLLVTGIIYSPFNEILGLNIQHRIMSCFGGLLLAATILIVLTLIGRVLFKKDAFGGGDLKIFAAIGTFIGFKYVITCFVISCLSAVIIFLPFVIFNKKNLKTYIPFGPFLSLGAFLTVLLYRTQFFNTVLGLFIL